MRGFVLVNTFIVEKPPGIRSKAYCVNINAEQSQNICVKNVNYDELGTQDWPNCMILKGVFKSHDEHQPV